MTYGITGVTIRLLICIKNCLLTNSLLLVKVLATFPKLKSPNQVDSYTGIIKGYSKMANARHLAMPSGNNAQTSLFGSFAEIATHKGPTHASITNTYKAA